MKPHKISYIYQDKQKSFVPKWYKNCTISLQLNCRFFLYKEYDTRDPYITLILCWGPTQCPYPVWGPKIVHRLHGKKILNWLSSFVYILLTNQKPNTYMSNICVLRNIFFQLQVDKMSFLAETSSRWGLIRGPFPVWGPISGLGPNNCPQISVMCKLYQKGVKNPL